MATAHDVFDCVKKARHTIFVPAHDIHLARHDWFLPSQLEGSHKSTSSEPVSTKPESLVRRGYPCFTPS